MDEAELVRMANQIALFHAAYPPARAAAAVAEHLERFWTPEMRAQLGALQDRSPLHALVVAALERAAD